MQEEYEDRVDGVCSDTIDRLKYRGNFSEIHYRGVHDNEWPGQLFIADIFAAENYMLLKALNIDMVVSVTDEDDVPVHFDRLKHGYIKMRVDDKAACDDSLLFQMKETEVLEKIRDGLYHSNVLVHCHAGISRSATVITCFLMQYINMSATKAVETVLASRRGAFYEGKHFNFPKTLAHFKVNS